MLKKGSFHNPVMVKDDVQIKYYIICQVITVGMKKTKLDMWRKLSAEALVLLNCDVGEDSRVPWTARRSNQSILKEINPGCSLEGMMLKLKSSTLATSYKELTHWKRLWCWEGLGAGGEGDDRGWDGWMASPTRWTWVWVNSRVGDGQGGLACCDSWSRKESDTTERLNWTEHTYM